MITLTEKAAARTVDMMRQNEIDPESSYGLRVGIKAGGCSGMNYMLDIVDNPRENDRVFQTHGVNIYCDPKSYLYLKDTQIDWEDGMMDAGFKFNNPNAKRSCGCGTSFTT